MDASGRAGLAILASIFAGNFVGSNWLVSSSSAVASPADCCQISSEFNICMDMLTSLLGLRSTGL